ncbi:hypothetical protein C8R47DRAFT_1219399 [Mycena vitilis]|nr:hypothetical protein C8R47DRAFT_1219399 [Mycena vitilis]
MLVHSDDGGPGEIYHVMDKAPISWSPILVLENITSTMILWGKVTEHEKALVHAWKSEASKMLTADNLGAALRSLGVNMDQRPKTFTRQAHFLSSDEHPLVDDIPREDELREESNTLPANEEEVLKQAYQTIREKQQGKPPRVYPFPKNDHVVTKMGKMPPGPCRLCGSEKHWNRECPNYVLYDAGTKRAGNATEARRGDEEDELYNNAFTVLLNQRLASSAIDYSRFRAAASPTEVVKFKTARPVEGTSYSTQDSREGEDEVEGAGKILDLLPTAREGNGSIHHLDTLVKDNPVEKEEVERRAKPSVEIEELEEEELAQLSPVNPGVLLESAEMEIEEVEAEEGETREPKRWSSRKRARDAARYSKTAEEFWLNDGRMFPEEGLDGGGDLESDDGEEEHEQQEREAYHARAERREAENDGIRPDETVIPSAPKELTPVRLHKRRSAAAGRSAIGTSVLSVKGWVGSLDTEPIDIRVDSCADVTLVSLAHYNSLPHKPAIQAGIPMKLIQLTQEEAGIDGYVRLPIYMISEEGELIESEAEAYVVPGMSVPILLGEDYSLTYEISLTRNVERGSRLHFNNWEFTVRAEHVGRTLDTSRILLSSQHLGGVTKSKRHRTKLVRQKRKAKRFDAERLIVRASRDYRIRAHECRSILVEGYFENDKEWLVEKNLLSNANGSYFTVPNVLISSMNPWIPVSNPTDQPRMIRKGEAVGQLTDPGKFFDKPSSQ